MSTKITLSYDESDRLKYHLYQECYENDNVWLQLDDASCFEVHRDGGVTGLRVGIPVEIFRHMVEGWLNSPWGQDLKMDHYRPTTEEEKEFLRVLNEFLEKSKNS